MLYRPQVDGTSFNPYTTRPSYPHPAVRSKIYPKLSRIPSKIDQNLPESVTGSPWVLRDRLLDAEAPLEPSARPRDPIRPYTAYTVVTVRLDAVESVRIRIREVGRDLHTVRLSCRTVRP